MIPVAILTMPDFDAATVDPASFRFGRTGTEAAPQRWALEDVDGDSDVDLILQFDTQQTGIRCGDSTALLKGLTPADARHLARAAEHARLLTKAAHDTPELSESSVDLVVTSPPFLTVVNYKMDNWLRCWFCGIDPADVHITNLRRVDLWQAAMAEVFRELPAEFSGDGRS